MHRRVDEIFFSLALETVNRLLSQRDCEMSGRLFKCLLEGSFSPVTPLSFRRVVMRLITDIFSVAVCVVRRFDDYCLTIANCFLLELLPV